MKQKKSYPYNQHTAPESSEFNKLCKEIKELNLPKEYLLDLYILVRSSRHNKAGALTPFQPKVAATMEENFPQYNKKLANIMTIMKTIEPLVFIQNFGEHFNSGNYCNAVENGAVYEQFLSAAGKANRLIVIDPNPFMVEQICLIEDDTLRNRFTLAFKDSHHVSVYKSVRQLRGIDVSLLSDLRVSEDDNVRVLHFARFENQNCSKKIKQDMLFEDLKSIKRGFPNSNKWRIFSFIPTAMLESSESIGSLRKQMMEQFNLEKIYLIDPKAVMVTGYSKLCLVTLSYMPKIKDLDDLHQKLVKRTVTLQRCDLEEIKTQQPTEPPPLGENGSDKECKQDDDTPARKALVDQERYHIGAIDFYSSETTIHKIYNSGQLKNHSPKTRKPSEKYNVSTEISFSYSGKVLEDGKIRPRIIFQGFVDRNNCDNYIAKKREVHYQDQNKVYDSVDQMRKHIESIVLEDPTLHGMIKSSIAAKYDKNPISLKTFCILNIEKLRDKKFYEDIYNKVFEAPSSSDYPICKLVLGNLLVNEVMKAIAETAVVCKLEDRETEDLLRQLFTIFSLAIESGYVKENPVYDIIREMDEQNNELLYFKKHMTDKTLSDDQESAIITELLKDEEKGFAVGMLIKIFTGLTFSEICALTWKDYYKIAGHDCMMLNIDKRFEDKGTDPMQYLVNSKIRQVPVSTFIEPMLSAWKKETDKIFKRYKLTGIAKDSKPLIYKTSKPLVPVTPDALRNYANKLYIMHGPQGNELSLADGKGGKKKYNTSKYAGDKFRENLYYHGLYTAGLDEGELCYLLGIHATGTFEENYAGYYKSDILVKMRDKVDVWAAKNIGNLNLLDQRVTRFTLTQKNRHFTSQPTVVPMEMIFEMKITEDSPDIQIELFNRLGFDVICTWK